MPQDILQNDKKLHQLQAKTNPSLMLPNIKTKTAAKAAVFSKKR